MHPQLRAPGLSPAPGVLTQPPDRETEARTTVLPPEQPSQGSAPPQHGVGEDALGKMPPWHPSQAPHTPCLSFPAVGTGSLGNAEPPSTAQPPRLAQEQEGKGVVLTQPAKPAPPGSSSCRWHRPGHGAGRWQQWQSGAASLLVICLPAPGRMSSTCSLLSAKHPGREAELPCSLFGGSFSPSKSPGLAPRSGLPGNASLGNTGILSKGVVGAGVAPTCLKPFGALKPPPILQKLGGHKSSSVPRTACLCFPASSPSPPRARYGHIPQKIYWGSLRALLERTVLAAKPHSQ